jgi:hypothetical protein
MGLFQIHNFFHRFLINLTNEFHIKFLFYKNSAFQYLMAVARPAPISHAERDALNSLIAQGGTRSGASLVVSGEGFLRVCKSLFY